MHQHYETHHVGKLAGPVDHAAPVHLAPFLHPPLVQAMRKGTHHIRKLAGPVAHAALVRRLQHIAFSRLHTQPHGRLHHGLHASHHIRQPPRRQDVELKGRRVLQGVHDLVFLWVQGPGAAGGGVAEAGVRCLCASFNVCAVVTHTTAEPLPCLQKGRTGSAGDILNLQQPVAVQAVVKLYMILIS